MPIDTHEVPHPGERSVAVPTNPIWRLSVPQYHHMIHTGILTDDDPVELLEGWLVTKMPKIPPHRIATRLTREAIALILPAGWYVDSQEPITLADSEPEPDVVIVRGETQQYLDRHPGPQDVELVIEVSDATLLRDRTLKQRLYATAGIPIYWIVNLPDRQVEVYTAPSGPTEEPGYRQHQDFGSEDETPVVIGGVEAGCLAVRDLIPKCIVVS